MKKDITKELLYLIAGIQTKTKCKISIFDLSFLDISLNDIENYATFITENKKYYHYCVYLCNIGLTLLIYK